MRWFTALWYLMHFHQQCGCCASFSFIVLRTKGTLIRHTHSRAMHSTIKRYIKVDAYLPFFDGNVSSFAAFSHISDRSLLCTFFFVGSLLVHFNESICGTVWQQSTQTKPNQTAEREREQRKKLSFNVINIKWWHWIIQKLIRQRIWP